MSSAGSVWYVWCVWYIDCMVAIAAEHCRYGSMEGCGVSIAEYLVHLMRMNRVRACRVLWGVHSWQLEWHKM